MTADQRELAELSAEDVARWVTQLMLTIGDAGFACFSGDCPHNKREECVQELLDEVRTDKEYNRALRAARGEG